MILEARKNIASAVCNTALGQRCLSSAQCLCSGLNRSTLHPFRSPRPRALIGPLAFGHDVWEQKMGKTFDLPHARELRLLGHPSQVRNAYRQQTQISPIAAQFR